MTNTTLGHLRIRMGCGERSENPAFKHVATPYIVFIAIRKECPYKTLLMMLYCL